MAKKTNKKDEMTRNHGMMHGGGKAWGILYIIAGVLFIFIGYQTSPVLMGAIIATGVGIWLFTIGSGKLGWRCWGMGGCCCGCSDQECDCDAEHKQM